MEMNVTLSHYNSCEAKPWTTMFLNQVPIKKKRKEKNTTLKMIIHISNIKLKLRNELID